jgi:dihydroorotate dehydrogenase electron transfer subunit
MHRFEEQRPGASQIRAPILWNREVAPGYRRMALETGKAYAGAEAGQFVMVGLADPSPRLLRRPFSIHRRLMVEGGEVIELLYRVVGPTTQAMSSLAAGATIDLVGPLGRGFRVLQDVRKVTLVAGGIGVAPMLFLAETLVQRQGTDGIGVYIGGRNCNDLLCVEEFERLGVPVWTTTEDGSSGDQCLVTLPLERAADRSSPELICACGPPAMLDCVAQIAKERGISCQVCIEAVMACGIGACLGCAVAAEAPDTAFRHVCRDGPVFDAAQLAWPIRD